MNKNIALANWFIEKSIESNRSLTQMQLHKLMYFAHALSLAGRDKPLVSGEFEAWKYGPVLSSLYVFTKHHGKKAIREKIAVRGKNIMQLSFPSVSDKEDIEILESTWKTFSKFDAIQLSKLSHEKDSPWDQYFDEDYSGITIPNEAIADFYRDRVSDD